MHVDVSVCSFLNLIHQQIQWDAPFLINMVHESTVNKIIAIKKEPNSIFGATVLKGSYSVPK